MPLFFVLITSFLKHRECFCCRCSALSHVPSLLTLVFMRGSLRVPLGQLTMKICLPGHAEVSILPSTRFPRFTRKPCGAFRGLFLEMVFAAHFPAFKH